MCAARTYCGGCHCGAVRYEVSTDLGQILDCNCSICQKRGALWSFVKAADFKLTAGGDTLADYQFGKRTIHHLFCPTCGVGSFSHGVSPDGAETVAINVRCLDEVDIATLSPVEFDGRSL